MTVTSVACETAAAAKTYSKDRAKKVPRNVTATRRTIRKGKSEMGKRKKRKKRRKNKKRKRGKGADGGEGGSGAGNNEGDGARDCAEDAKRKETIEDNAAPSLPKAAAEGDEAIPSPIRESAENMIKRLEEEMDGIGDCKSTKIGRNEGRNRKGGATNGDGIGGTDKGEGNDTKDGADTAAEKESSKSGADPEAAEEEATGSYELLAARPGEAFRGANDDGALPGEDDDDKPSAPPPGRSDRDVESSTDRTRAPFALPAAAEDAAATANIKETTKYFKDLLSRNKEATAMEGQKRKRKRRMQRHTDSLAEQKGAAGAAEAKMEKAKEEMAEAGAALKRARAALEASKLAVEEARFTYSQKSSAFAKAASEFNAVFHSAENSASTSNVKPAKRQRTKSARAH